PLDYAPEEVLQRLRNWVVDVHTPHAAAHGKTHWAEKTAVNVFYLDEIERLIGNDAKSVVGRRNGVAVRAASSATRQSSASSRVPVSTLRRAWSNCRRRSAATTGSFIRGLSATDIRPKRSPEWGANAPRGCWV